MKKIVYTISFLFTVSALTAQNLSDPDAWTYQSYNPVNPEQLGGGEISFNIEEHTIAMISGDSDNQGNEDLTLAIEGDQEINFDWAYTTVDDAEWDDFGYLLNGVYTILIDPQGTNDQNGSVTLSLTNGDEFGFRTHTVDGQFGAATTTISNLQFTQVITFGAISNVTYGESPNLSATTNSGLAINYSSSNENVATISGSTVTIVGTGTITITASQGGNANYTIAAQVMQDLTIDPATLTITANNRTITYGGDANMGNSVTYEGFVNGEDEAVLGGTLEFGDILATDAGFYEAVIVPSGQTSSNYDITFANGDLTIDLAALTITADNRTITYGDNNANTSNSVSYEGFVNSEDEAVLGGALEFGDIVATDAGFYEAVIVPSGQTSSNYDITFANGDLTIDLAALTITADNRTITYGDNNANTGNSVSYEGFVNSEDEAVLGGALEFGDIVATDAGFYEAVIVPSGQTSSNYDITFANGDLTIEPAALTITADNRTISYGDNANTGNSVTYEGFVNGENEGILIGELAFADIVETDAGFYEAVIVPSGQTSPNYDITFVNGDLTIDPTQQIIMFDELLDIAFTEGSFELTASASSGLPITYESSDLNIATIDGSIVNFITEGTIDITANQSGNNNYNAAVSAVQSLTINSKLSQLIPFDDDLTGFIFTENPYATYTLPELSDADLHIIYESDNLNVATMDGNVMTIVGAGNATITARQIGDETYNPAPVVPNTVMVAMANQTISFNELDDRTVLDDPFELAATTNSGLSLTYSSSDPLVATISGSIVSIEGIGTTTITASQAGNVNYNAAAVPRVLTVTKVPLTAAANNMSRSYGATNPALSISYSGFANGDDSSVLEEVPTVSTEANGSSDVGDYPILLTGGLDETYEVIPQSGTLSITKAALTVSTNDQSRTYGAPNPTLAVTYDGFFNGDDESELDTAPTVTTADATSDAGTFPIEVSGGEDNNYNFSYLPGTLTINPASLLITAENKSKTYGDPNPTLSFMYSGFVNEDNESKLDGSPVATTVANEFSNSGNYPIEVSGGADLNYIFEYAGGTLTINQAFLEAKADDQTMEEGAGFPMFTISYSGFVNNDDASDIDTEPTASTSVTDSSLPGTFDIVLSGGTDNNYLFNLKNGTLTIDDVLGLLLDNAIKIYPNPGEDFVMIEFTNITSIDLFDINGKRQFVERKENRIDISNLARGTYLLLIKDSNGSILSKNRLIKR